MLHQLVAQATGAVQAAHAPTDGGGVPIGYVLATFVSAFGVMVGVVRYLNSRVEKAHAERVEDLLKQVARKDAVNDALKEQVADLTQQLIALHATAGADRDRAVRAVRAATRIFERLKVVRDDRTGDDDGDDEDDG